MAQLTPDDLRELGLPEGYTTGTPAGWCAEYNVPAAGPAWSFADRTEAAEQTLLRGLGCLRGQQLHPLALAAVEAGKDSLPAVLRTIFAARHPGSVDYSATSTRVIKAALGSGDLPQLLGTTARGIARKYRSQQLQDLIAISTQLEAIDYRPNSYSLVDLGDLPPPSDQFGREYTEVNILATGEPFKLLALYAKIGISIQALANDDRGLVAAGVKAFLTAAARNEAALAYGLIHAYPVNAQAARPTPQWGRIRIHGRRYVHDSARQSGARPTCWLEMP
jgi:hypothetical protein